MATTVKFTFDTHFDGPEPRNEKSEVRSRKSYSAEEIDAMLEPDLAALGPDAAEIGRAIRSGVSRNGQALHWQGMIWDHASNWDEEDIRALIAYLRLLPAVNKKIQPDRAPAADDA